MSSSQNFNDELLAEYKFDYQKAKSNRFVKETISEQAWVNETRILIDEGIASLAHGERTDLKIKKISDRKQLLYP